MPSPQGLERRHRIRYRARIKFSLKGEQLESEGMTRNISLLGISGYTNKPVESVAPVDCYLDLPDRDEPLLVYGTVIRSTNPKHDHPDGSYELGVFFKAFPGDAEKVLIDYLDKVAVEEQSAIEAGFEELKQRQAERKRKKRLEALRKKRRQAKREKVKAEKEAKKKAAEAKKLAKKTTAKKTPAKKTAASKKSTKA